MAPREDDVAQTARARFWVTIDVCLHELVGEVSKQLRRRNIRRGPAERRDHICDVLDSSVNDKAAMAQTHIPLPARHAARNNYTVFAKHATCGH